MIPGTGTPLAETVTGARPETARPAGAKASYNRALTVQLALLAFASLVGVILAYRGWSALGRTLLAYAFAHDTLLMGLFREELQP